MNEIQTLVELYWGKREMRKGVGFAKWTERKTKRLKGSLWGTLWAGP